MATKRKRVTKQIRVTVQAYEHAEKVVASMLARGLSVSKTSVFSEVIMLCPIEDEPQPVEKKRRKAVEVSTAEGALVIQAGV